MLENRDIYWRTSENLNQNNRPEVIFDGYLEMTLRQTLVLSEGISQLCKYLVWFDLLVVTVESFRFDVEKGLRNKLNTQSGNTNGKFTLWFISLFLKSRVRRFSSYTPRKTKKIPPNHHESTYFYRFSKWRASRPVHLQSTDINLLVSFPYLKLFCINF